MCVTTGGFIRTRYSKIRRKEANHQWGWFYGFKLHIIINHQGELLAFCLTSGNIDDRNLAVMSMFTKEIFGKLYADRGYISHTLFEKLLSEGITLVPNVKKIWKTDLWNYLTNAFSKSACFLNALAIFWNIFARLKPPDIAALPILLSMLSLLWSLIHIFLTNLALLSLTILLPCPFFQLNLCFFLSNSRYIKFIM